MDKMDDSDCNIASVCLKVRPIAQSRMLQVSVSICWLQSCVGPPNGITATVEKCGLTSAVYQCMRTLTGFRDASVQRCKRSMWTFRKDLFGVRTYRCIFAWLAVGIALNQAIHHAGLFLGTLATLIKVCKKNFEMMIE